ncbi:type III-B CRISPR module RAMP protein Cmr6 [Moraxella bovoculi]|uniref:type III-B CRISPR module RAMP protein Cmr6 n=1 Tax=Moraxella bovoculi TaxID=386891 RepID=UPI003F4F5345
MLPIYNSTQTYQSAKAIFGNHSHSGLWFERFYDYQIFDNQGNLLQDKRQKDDAKKEQKANFLDVFNSGNKFRKCGNDKALSTYAKRMAKLCQANRGKVCVYKNDWLVAIGLGNSHPLENGLLWHPTLGVPYFQGSTVKGMARALMTAWRADESIISKWFGSSSADGQTGDFVFLDAVPVSPVMLKETLATPHYGDWYLKGADNPTDKSVQPADWHSPVPVGFLAVEKAVMQFGVMPRQGANVSDDEIEQINNVITLALEHIGIGAKTATGYGRMVIDESANRKMQKELEEEQAYLEKQKAELEAQKKLQESLKNASEIEKQLATDITTHQWEKAGNAVKESFTQSISDWLDKLEADPDPQAIVRFVQIAHIHYPAQMKRPDRAKPNQQVWIKRLLALQK